MAKFVNGDKKMSINGPCYSNIDSRKLHNDPQYHILVEIADANVKFGHSVHTALGPRTIESGNLVKKELKFFWLKY